MDELAKVTSAYDKKMVMKREAIADRAVWIAKKRYILNVHNNEGVQYAKPKIKMQGVQAVQSSTPAMCRTEFARIFEVIMTKGETEVQEAIRGFREKFYSAQIEDVSFPRGVNKIKEYLAPRGSKTPYVKETGKSCPINSRAAILHNHLVKTLGLEKTHQLIKAGDKIRYVYLKTPNPLNENVIGFPFRLPEEFGLNDFIDFETQLEKAYLSPLRDVLDAIGWKIEPIATLEDFFC